MGVVEAECCDWVPGVVSLREHGEVCQCSEQLGHVCDCASDGATNVAVEHQWNDTSSAMQAHLLVSHMWCPSASRQGVNDCLRMMQICRPVSCGNEDVLGSARGVLAGGGGLG